MATDTTPLSPDTHAAGFRGVAPDALRYDGHTDDPAEVAGILHTLMPAGIKVLDIGCGTGSVALIANRGKGNQVVAVEPDPARAAVAAKRGLDVTCGFLDADFVARHGPFDIVMMSDVMEHLAAPADMVSLVRAGLTENGAMLVSVPNVAHWSVRLGLMFGRFNYADVGIMDATHLRWFTTRTIRELFERNGFTVESVRHTAGVRLPVYYTRPLSYIPERIRSPLIRLFNRMLPNLFGCQVVIKARLER